MTTFETWKYFYIHDFCTEETLQLLVQLGTLTQEQYDEIIASKPDLTGRVVQPIPKDESTTTATETNTDTTTPSTQQTETKTDTSQVATENNTTQQATAQG